MTPDGKSTSSRRALSTLLVLVQLGLSVMGLAGSAHAQALLAEPEWYELTLIAPGLVLVVPAGWEQASEGQWQLGTDRRFMVGWTPQAEGGPEALAWGMHANVMSGNATADVRVEDVLDSAGKAVAYDLVGTSTDAAGTAHWQWTRLVQRHDDSIVLIAVQGDFGDAARIAETRSQVGLTMSSLLNVLASEEEVVDYQLDAAHERITLGPLALWQVLEHFWRTPQIKAELTVEIGFVAADEAAASQQLLAGVRAATALEVEVVVPGSTGAGEPEASDPAPVPEAGDLVLRMVGREPDDDGAGDPMAAFRNERVRWVRHAFAPGLGGTWVLRAEVDLQVTHADDFLDNAFTSLAPVFDGWAVSPLETPSTTR